MYWIFFRIIPKPYMNLSFLYGVASHVAGQTKVLKPGDSIFRSGDPSDGMYLVRRGELVVYLDQGGKEVVLATIGEGGMVGEMALFDQKPRSASVKASKDTEVTQITNDDFTKLMKQIPKWFVTLMSTLSTRLRVTNERLQKAESGGAVSSGTAKPFEELIRTIVTIELLWNKEGSKEGQKEWALPRKNIEDFARSFFGRDSEKFSKVIDILAAASIITSKSDAQKQTVLTAPNRGAFRQITDFLKALAPHVQAPPIPRGLSVITESASKAAQNAAYDSLTITLDDMASELAGANLTINDIHPAVAFISKFAGDTFKLVKASGKSGFGVKVEKKSIATLARNMTLLDRFAKDNLIF